MYGSSNTQMENNQLQLVKEHAERKQQQLSERFEKAMVFVDNERRQLEELKSYEADYLQKIQDQQQQCDASNADRYRSFYHQLSQAIEQHEIKLTTAEQQLDTMRKELSQHYQRLNVLDDLIKRQRIAAAHQVEKWAQKELDEFASRRQYH